MEIGIDDLANSAHRQDKGDAVEQSIHQVRRRSLFGSAQSVA
jgi:hypothetical protein